MIKVYPAQGLDLSIYCTLREITYARCLAGLIDATLSIWRGRLMASKNAFCFKHSLLRVDLCYLHKIPPYWRKLFRHERRARYFLGLAVPYKSFTVSKLRPLDLEYLWASLNTLWSLIEVPKGFMVVLPHEFSHLSSVIADYTKSWW